MDGHLKNLKLHDDHYGGTAQSAEPELSAMREGGQLELPPESGGGPDGKIDLENLTPFACSEGRLHPARDGVDEVVGRLAEPAGPV